MSIRQPNKPEILESTPSPDFFDLIQGIDPARAVLLEELHDIGLFLEAVKEKILYDGFCRHWTPAYYAGDRQLFHVHNFRAGLRASMFVGVKQLEPLVLDSEDIPSPLRLQVAKTPEHRGTKMVKVPIASSDDLEAFRELVLVKWNLITDIC